MSKPCAELSVVEVAIGVSDLGLGMAGGVPGMMLADLGAEVTRVVGTSRPAIDRQVPWGQMWHRDKRVVISDDPDYVRGLLRGADVALIYGPESQVEQRGLGYLDRHRDNPGLVYARCRPSRTGRGTVPDWSLLVEADAGFCTQLEGHRPGPIFVDVRASAAGTAFLLTTSVLALLRRRALTGAGGWAETSLYDGMLATLGCMIGRSERAPAEVEGYWAKGSTFPNFLYRCADDELIQVWFGGKGMYAKLIDVLGDEPSTEGYYVDQAKGMLGVRAQRWKATFATQPRDVWIERLRAVGVACEPVYGPGEVLSDPHLIETGLAVTHESDGHVDLTVTTPIAITPVEPADPAEPDGSVTATQDHSGGAAVASKGGRVGSGGGWSPGTTSRSQNGSGLLAGVKVLDFSAFVAGPLAAEVLADLGADVIKVEPPEGEAMRGAAYAIAACQRGKRSLAMDLTAPDARPVVERLIRWADVVLHNFRVGVSERLGIDEATVARLNPDAVYCHASAFGTTGPRAKAPGNDALMQALTGFERANGGAGNDPIAGTWIPLDMAGGWVAATGILAGLYGRASDGRGRQVATSLLGAAILLHGGVFQRDGQVVRGPELDGAQTGYGPAYRIYEAGDGEWFALVLPDEDAWRRLHTLLGDTARRHPGLPVEYVPLRGGIDDALARQAEVVLEQAFTSASAVRWVERLRQAGLLVEPIEPAGTSSRDTFRRGILDDPVNRQLGRVASYGTADWGDFEQIGPLLRCGPGAAAGPIRQMLPRVGEHSTDVLAELGFEPSEVDGLLDAKIIRQL
jgi:crotonobetainyl-CoA:carnitine CoA-transferase CaiB-like acyl-CoA transferase